jgi:hypothetical protein
MSKVHVVKLVNPSDGETVDLPESIGRVNFARAGPLHRPQSIGRAVFTVVGTGDKTPHVVLTEGYDGETTTDLPPQAQVIGCDGWTDTLVYAVPRDAYGGGEA